MIQNQFFHIAKSSLGGTMVFKFNSLNRVMPFVICNCKFSTSSTFHKKRETRGTRILYEKSRKGIYEKDDSRYKVEYLRDGFKELKTEVRKWREEMVEKLEDDPIMVQPGDTDKIFEFKSEKDLSPWVVTSDRDHEEGFSNCSFTMSPAGHGLFSGNIDTTIIKDGDITRAGYANISYALQKSFKRRTCFDWMPYTHLVLRVRGDGRRYGVTLSTSGEFDISWHDLFLYTLFTRGGPYWQVVHIPFSKFLLTAKGRIQDKQFPLPLTRINKIGITLADDTSAPFRLEIDYIAVHSDPVHTEEFAYEMYRVAPFII